MKEPTNSNAEQDDYSDGLVAIEKYEYALPSKKSFRPWHWPRKQFIRNDQWCHFTKLLIDEIQISDGSLTYFGLPGADLLDLRCFSTSVCEPKSLKLRFMGFPLASRCGVCSWLLLARMQKMRRWEKNGEVKLSVLD
jgi:hypothetical protein